MIKVHARLASGRARSRLHRDILAAIDKAIWAAQPANIIPKHVMLEGEALRADGLSFPLKKYRRILVIGGGKASGYMGEEIEKILGKRISGGLVIIPDYLKPRLRDRRIDYRPSTHPVPSLKGLRAVVSMLDLVKNVSPSDLVIVLLSGGGSALMPLPPEGISLQDEQRLTSLLLKSEANIQEINTVRKHLSRVKGGRLANRLFPATVLTLIMSDVVRDKLDAIASGPTAPDHTTYQDAQTVLKKYNVWTKVPETIRKIIKDGVNGSLADTPKKGDKVFRHVHNLIVGNNKESCTAASLAMRKVGYNTQVLSTRIPGEAREVGGILGSILTDIRDNGLALSPPAALVAGGETTVTVKGNGKGGRNQELALAAALGISGSKDVVIGSIATDGIDGPTEAAGAIADGTTVARGLKLGMDPDKYLGNNDSYHY